MNFLQKQQQQLFWRRGGGWEVICMGLREIGAQICPLILLAQMPISAEQPLGYLKLGEIINPQQLWSRLRRAAPQPPSFSEPL